MVRSIRSITKKGKNHERDRNGMPYIGKASEKSSLSGSKIKTQFNGIQD
jgi:hypothetical protein